MFADRLNFTRAAEELHISQPALHVKVTKLGSTLGVTLYERDGRGLVLTPAGSALARFAAGYDDQLRDFVAGLTAPDDEPPLVLAAGEGAHLYVLAGAVRRLLSRGGDLRLLTTNTDRTIEAVQSGTADVGVAVFGRRPAGLDVVPIATYPQVLILPAGHALARHRSVSLAHLAGATLVVAPPDRPQRRDLERALRRAGVTWTIGIETEGWAPMLHFVALGVGLAVVNGCVVPGEGLVARPIDDLPTVTYAALRRRASRADTRVEGLLDLLQASAP